MRRPRGKLQWRNGRSVKVQSGNTCSYMCINRVTREIFISPSARELNFSNLTNWRPAFLSFPRLLSEQSMLTSVELTRSHDLRDNIHNEDVTTSSGASSEKIEWLENTTTERFAYALAIEKHGERARRRARVVHRGGKGGRGR